ncbi:hypothetical protein SRHO_G00095100 [Serrasalmus rhombeus]
MAFGFTGVDTTTLSAPYDTTLRYSAIRIKMADKDNMWDKSTYVTQSNMSGQVSEQRGRAGMADKNKHNSAIKLLAKQKLRMSEPNLRQHTAELPSNQTHTHSISNMGACAEEMLSARELPAPLTSTNRPSDTLNHQPAADHRCARSSATCTSISAHPHLG